MDDIDKVVKFIQKYLYPTATKEVIWLAVEKHLEYDTFLVGWDDNNEVIYTVAWNITGLTAHILHFAIREDYRKKIKFTDLLEQGLKKFPYVRFIKWERRKYKSRPFFISVEELRRKK